MGRAPTESNELQDIIQLVGCFPVAFYSLDPSPLKTSEDTTCMSSYLKGIWMKLLRWCILTMDQHIYTLCFPRSAFLFEWNSKKTLSQNEPSCFNENFFINRIYENKRKDIDIKPKKTLITQSVDRTEFLWTIIWKDKKYGTKCEEC